jgi:PAP2 superfamily
MPADIGVVTLPRDGFLMLLRKAFAAHGILLFPISLYCVAYEIFQESRPDIDMASIFPGIIVIFLTLLAFLVLSLLIMRFYHIARYVKPESPARELMRDMKAYLSDRRRLANGLPALLIMTVIAFVFSEVRGHTLQLGSMLWDAKLAEADKWVHFGRHPWEWLQPIVGYAPITFLINLNYNMWFFSMIMMVIWFGFSREASQDRTRFLLTYVGIWGLGGNILAIYFASAGPCFYSRMGLSPDPYQGLMTYLHHVNETIPIWAVSLQDALWQNHATAAQIREISAMPSLHNASALLFAILGYRISRGWGHVLAVHAFLIYIGSIHLGWHYAIDAYVGWAVTLFVWTISGPLTRWWHAKDVQRQYDAALAAA